jgi:LysR family nitrogen assimilation transcriptional regulator
MDFKQFRYFVQIAEFGNMTRASESLHIAQPALSQQMANLESELGTRLFDRSVQGVKMTPAGERLYRHAKSLLKQLDGLHGAVSQESEYPSGRVAIGIPGSTGKILSAPLLRELANFEGILLEIVERPSAELVDLLVRGRLDIAVTVDVQPRRGITISPLLLEELYVVHRPDDGGVAKSVRLAEVAKHPLILPCAPSTIRQRVDAAFLDEHLKYQLVAEVGATDMLVRLVIAGLGWTVLPWAAFGEEIQQGRVIGARITGKIMQRELSLCVSDILPLGPAALIVRDRVIAIFNNLLASQHWPGATSIPR